MFLNRYVKIILVIVGLFSFKVYGQNDDKNAVKLNVIPLVIGEFAVEYERGITDRISLNAGFGYMPDRSLPFKSIIAKEVGSSSIIDATKLAVFSVALEGRYYLKKKDNQFQGVYVGPFVKYSRYDVSTSVDYAVGSLVRGSLPLVGDYNTFSAGLAVGMQWMLTRQFLLDWRIIGFGYGHANGSVLGKRALSSVEQQEILDKLHIFADDLPVLGLKPELTDQGVRVKINGPWYGIRTALSVGYRF